MCDLEAIPQDWLTVSRRIRDDLGNHHPCSCEDENALAAAASERIDALLADGLQPPRTRMVEETIRRG